MSTINRIFLLVIFSFIILIPTKTFAAFSFNKSITVNSGQVTGTLTNFPMLVTGTYSFLATTANGGDVQNANGYDVGFYQNSNCSTGKLNWETIKYTATTGNVVYWVNVPSVSTGTVIYVCYGDAGITTDQSNRTAVWDSNYKGVYHLADNAANTTITESTANAHSGTNVANTSTKTVTGPFAAGTLGSGLTYNGSTDQTTIPATTDYSYTNIGSWTYETWIKPADLAGARTFAYIFDNSGQTPGSGGWGVRFGNQAVTAGILQFCTDGPFGYSCQSSTAVLTAGSWTHIVYTLNYVSGNTYTTTLYANGVPQSIINVFRANPATLINKIGLNGGNGNINSVLAETRISNTARSANWITAQYNNQSNPALFYEIQGPLSISTVSLPNGIRNSAYSQTVSATGGTSPYTFSISAGSLPPGLSISSTGVVSGTPTTVGTYSFTVKVTDNIATESTKNLSITIAPIVCTTLASGNWSSVGTWSGCNSGIPGNQDAVVVSTGHTLTVDTNTIIGASGVEGTTAIQANNTSSLIISANVSLTVRGDVIIGDATSASGATLTMNAGSSFYFDSSLSATPSATAYKLQIGNYSYANPSSRLITNGTSGNRVTISSVLTNGAKYGYITSGDKVDAGDYNLNYTDFSYLNDTSNNESIHGISLEDTPDKQLTILNSTFNYCGAITMERGHSSATINIQNNNWRNSIPKIVGPHPTVLNVLGGSATSALRNVSYNVFDYKPRLFYMSNATIVGNVFLDKFEFYQDMPTIFQYNFLQSVDGTNISGPSGIAASATLDNNYMYASSAGTNQDWHGYQIFGNALTTATVTISNSIFESAIPSNVGSGEGAPIIVGDHPVNIYATNNIIVPDSYLGVASSGRLLAALGSSGTRFYGNNNTYFSNFPSDKVGAEIGEGGTDWPSMIQSLKNNIVWGGGYIAQTLATTPATDGMIVGAANYNNGYNLATGTCNNGSNFSCYGYNKFKFSSGTPGTNDLNVNPQFVDSTRNLKKWDLSLGGPGTEANAIAELAKLNLPTHNSNYTAQNLLAYVRAGFAPTNTALKGVASDGGDIGAVSVVDVVAPTVGITVPLASAIVSGPSVTVTATSTDVFGVVGVKFYRGATQIGSEITATSSPNTYTTTWDTTALSNAAYSLTAVSRDAAGNVATSTAVSVTVNNDASAPVLSELAPSGVQTVNTTSTTLSLTTNETATCKYGTTADTAYASIATTFTTTAGTTHSTPITGLTNGTSYTYYVRCIDGNSNANTSDATISFSVASPVSGGNGPISGGGTFSLPGAAISRPQIVYPDGRVVYTDTATTTTPTTGTTTPPVTTTPAIPTSTTPITSLFTRNLRQTNITSDVRQLQLFLNTFGFTIAATGPGSVGRETNVFGKLTRDAVIRFQETYRAEILTPFGLTRGTGFVGPATRAKILQLLGR